MDLKSFTNIKLKNIGKMSPMDTWLANPLNRFLKDLEANHLPTNIQFIFANEWFYWESTNIIAIPYYLYNKKLLNRLLKSQNFILEGSNAKSFQKLLRHEYGHFLEAAFSTRKWKIRRDIFGAKAKYASSYIPNQNPKDFVQHLEEHYAQSHPDEDFAETFAVWIGEKSTYSKKYANSLALQKLNAMSQIINKIQTKKQRKLKSHKQNYFSDNQRNVSQDLEKNRAIPYTKTRSLSAFVNNPLQYRKQLKKKWQFSDLELSYFEKRLILDLHQSSKLNSKMSSIALLNIEKQIINKKSYYIKM